MMSSSLSKPSEKFTSRGLFKHRQNGRQIRSVLIYTGDHDMLEVAALSPSSLLCTIILNLEIRPRTKENYS